MRLQQRQALCLAVVCLAGFGCATTRASNRCFRGGPRYRGPIKAELRLDNWRRARTSTVTVYTAAPASTASYAVQDIDGFVRLVSRLVFQDDFTPRKPIDLYLFENQSRFQYFAGCGVAGHMVPGEDAFSMGSNLEGRGAAVLQHEMVHALLANDASADYPAWFNEGLADFLASAVIRSDISTVGILTRRYALSRTQPLSLAEILSSGSAIQGSYRNTARFYADAWAFVHYGLMSHGMQGPKRSHQFMEYVRRVSHGEPWRSAFEPSFGAPLEEIEQEYQRHRKRLAELVVSPQFHIFIGAPGEAVSFEPIGTAEAARKLGRYALDLGEERQNLAAELFDVALRLEPEDPEALIGRLRAAAMRDEFEFADALWARLPASHRGSRNVRQAAADFARSPQPRLDLARLYLRAGNDEQASLQLEFVLDAYPDTKFATAARKLLDQRGSGQKR